MPDDRVVYELGCDAEITVDDAGGVWRVTPALRFVERRFGERVVRHLQQLYVSMDGEPDWRDVPLVRADG